MGSVLILGAGTAGTMLANVLRPALDRTWSVVLVDQSDRHDYQPGYLFIPFGRSTPERVSRDRWRQVGKGVDQVQATISGVDPASRTVRLADGRSLAYDWLVIATGARVRPDLVEGLTDPRVWRRSVFDFYTRDGATALREAVSAFTGGRLVVHIAEMPIKCPVAPLEFALLADDHFRRRRIRHKVDITYVTPLDGAFTKPVASRQLGALLKDKSIRLVTDFAVESVDADRRELAGYDGRRIAFDLLAEVPPHTGAAFLDGSPLADDMGFVEVDKHTLRSVHDERVFAVGDAANLPTSKAGSVAHFAVEQLAGNILAAIAGAPLPHSYDGHANCFIESGNGRGLLLDFNYDTEPLTGMFPAPVVGPMKLLAQSRLNHLGKLAFEPIYWNLLLPGRRIPGIPLDMSMRGKRRAPASGSK